MSDGNGGSGGGGGVRGGGGARDAEPQEPQTPGSPEGQTPALSPGSAAQSGQAAAAAGGGGGGTEAGAGFWMETWPLGPSPGGVCCGCIAEGAGGGWMNWLGVASGTHPDRRVPPRRHCAACSAQAGGGRDI